ncbi:hypothetical protein [Streptomyces griseofuscus]|uniref:hypothetical protein n=1 Tax=Streptomyces griseofuscus TaxID=146922 RepID=UPI0038159BE1
MLLAEQGRVDAGADVGAGDGSVQRVVGRALEHVPQYGDGAAEPVDPLPHRVVPGGDEGVLATAPHAATSSWTAPLTVLIAALLVCAVAGMRAGHDTE